MAKKDKAATASGSARDALRLTADGPASVAADATPVGPSSKAKAAERLAAIGTELHELQEALYAESARSVLLVLQGMDTSGKGGTIEHVVGLMNPQGVRIASFKRPTKTELRHDFLWRIRRQLPIAGQVGVFDRSHYEDVLVVRVNEIVAEDVWQARYERINEFEAEVAAAGTTVVKCFLHISPDEQKERLLARLDDPAKQWKYNPGDVDVRARWSAYQEAYADALTRCHADVAPWYVIPADRKWYRNWAVASLLLETLRELAPVTPGPTYDVATERARLTEADPID